jgi:undecaprenyl-phosphate 4-deoxy-4-formamido-L-arabinose transferase
LTSTEPQLSAVIPVFNEEASLERLHARLDAVLAGSGRPYEVIYVDDGSTDGSLRVLQGLLDRQPHRVRIVELYRNAGQFMAVLAGLERARGEVIVTLDADLQNPPEDIPRLLERIDAGHDVVNGWRRHRRDGPFRRLASRLANRVAARVTGLALRDHGCMLRACRREVVDQVIAHREHAAYLPTLVNALARRPAEIPVGHAGRAAGVSKYPLRRLLALQLDMLATFSVRPLRLLHLVGFAIAAAALLGGAAVALRRLAGSGGANDAVLALILGLGLLVGALFVALGLVAEIVGRTYDMVRDRPRYAVARVHEGRADPRPGGAAAAPGPSREPAAPGPPLAASSSRPPLASAADDALLPPAAGAGPAARHGG